MIRKTLAIAAAVTMTFASVAANAQAPVRVGAATVKPVAFAPTASSAVRTGAGVSDEASDFAGMSIAAIIALIAALAAAGYFIFDKESSPR
jgi:hypothetical protein